MITVVKRRAPLTALHVSEVPYMFARPSVMAVIRLIHRICTAVTGSVIPNDRGGFSGVVGRVYAAGTHHHESRQPEAPPCDGSHPSPFLPFLDDIDDGIRDDDCHNHQIYRSSDPRRGNDGGTKQDVDQDCYETAAGQGSAHRHWRAPHSRVPASSARFGSRPRSASAHTCVRR
jgi:hypothetical protein